MPDDRYAFCQGHLEAEFVKFRDPNDADRRWAREFLSTFRDSKPIPWAVLLERKNNQFLRRVPADIRLFMGMLRWGRHDRNNDFTRYSMRRLLAMYVRRRWNALHVRAAPLFEPLGERPFVLYAYQMQPESSIDVLSSYMSNQPELITQIARSLPATHELYVKPHPDHVGGLTRRQLTELKRIPGVRLISPFLPSHDLMVRAAVVLTPTGTMAFQAAMHGVPAVIFAPEFFRAMPGVHYCRTLTDLPQIFQAVLNQPRGGSDAAIVEFLAANYVNSFLGRVSPYGSAFDPAEIASLLSAYKEVFQKLTRQAPAALLARAL
jgi:hypothetical protein